MAVTSFISGVASRIVSAHPSTVPGVIAKGYVKYLWNYEPDSWVDRIASSYRMLTLLIAVPVIVLCGLDIISYGIARMLGVVDNAGASSGDRAPNNSATGEKLVTHMNESDPTHELVADHELMKDYTRTQRKAVSSLTPSQPKSFYATDPEGLRLSGADIFSPAVSGPPTPAISTPTVSRRVPQPKTETARIAETKLRKEKQRQFAQDPR